MIFITLLVKLFASTQGLYTVTLIYKVEFMTSQTTSSHQDKDFLDLCDFKAMFCSCVVAMWTIRSWSDVSKVNGKNITWKWRCAISISGYKLRSDVFKEQTSWFEQTPNLISTESRELQALVWKSPNKHSAQKVVWSKFLQISFRQTRPTERERERKCTHSNAWHSTHELRF